jgi:hypothetical protein
MAAQLLVEKSSGSDIQQERLDAQTRSIPAQA